MMHGAVHPISTEELPPSRFYGPKRQEEWNKVDPKWNKPVDI